MAKTLLLLPGDGIGVEVVGEAARVLDALGLDIDAPSALVGGASIDASGIPIAEEVVAMAKAADAVLLGAVGGPKWAGQRYDMRAEVALLRLRTELNVFANLRPVYCMKALSDASTLKRDVVEGLDILFVRELISGIYFGEPRGVEDLGNGEKRGVNTHAYTSSQIRGVARVAFELARTRTGQLCSVDKANVMEAGLLWREEVQAMGDADYPDVALSHMLADNCAMQLVKAPKQFDVIVTDNLFGDILSDAAAMLTGSLGMLPSGSIGEPGKPGIYEPIHGSAPDIAGRGIANPSAAILSLAMALRFSLGEPEAADRIEAAVDKALTAGARTSDLGGTLRTRAMGDAILAQL